ncbi:hypothetical protein KDK77_09150, partial [bacterium]|nr:hypothetical protein [bacterium]
VNNAIGTLHEIVDEEAHIIIGAIVQEELKDQAMVTLIATGLDGEPSPSAHKKDHIVTTIQSEPSVVTPIPQREAEDDVLSETVAEEDSEEEPQRNYEYKSVTPVTVTKKTIPQEPSKPIGFFEESDPTIHEGTNLDIPAFLRGKRQHPVSQ